LLVEAKLEVWDSPNSAGVVIDAIRCCKLALDNGLGGELTDPASYFMKTPMIQYSDEEAHRRTQEFIAKYALNAKSSPEAPKKEKTDKSHPAK
jgi:myo-inositol-1-phosphate synthase